MSHFEDKSRTCHFKSNVRHAQIIKQTWERIELNGQFYEILGKFDYFGDTIGPKGESNLHGSQTLLHIVERRFKIMVAYLKFL